MFCNTSRPKYTRDMSVLVPNLPTFERPNLSIPPPIRGVFKFVNNLTIGILMQILELCHQIAHMGQF